VGLIYKKIQEETGKNPKNICLMASWGKGVTVISNALRGNDDQKEIRHQVLFDETGALLSSRVVAFLLEPRHKSDELIDLSIALYLLSEIESAKGTKTSLKKFQSLQNAATQADGGSLPRSTRLVRGLLDSLHLMRSAILTGDPKKDWLQVRKILRITRVDELKAVDNAVQYLMAFNRGKKISESLSETWRENGEYRNARAILDKALSEIQLFSDDTDTRGIHVMTLHKAKGKEFDAVIIFDESRISPLLYGNERPPHTRCRKLLRVGITRAKHHVLLLTDRYNPTPLLKGFRLG
jgi:DNA helicase-2/ATP-dependent DNA helicase PcrA